MKHQKEHNLYQKKAKTGGSARYPLSQESVDANLKDAMPQTMPKTVNDKSSTSNSYLSIIICLQEYGED